MDTDNIVASPRRIYRLKQIPGLLSTSMIAVLLLLGACTHPSTPLLETPRCSSTVQAKVSALKPTITVAYTEPSINRAGNPLKELAKTSVYYDVGAGRVLAKEIPSTQPTGGGQISETITLPIKDQEETIVHICVTATDRQGHESLPTP